MAHRRGSTTELAALLASLDLSAFLPAFVDGAGVVRGRRRGAGARS